MGVNNKAIVNSFITEPTQDIIMPSSGVLRADPDIITVTSVSV